MTIKEVVDYIRNTNANAYADDTFMIWINELEADIQLNVFLLNVEDVISHTVETETLLADSAHCIIYRLYLSAMIDLANKEYSSYQNNYEVFKSEYSNYKIWYSNRYHPADGRAEASGYYISAYSLAAKYGFLGTEEEWVAAVETSRLSAESSAASALASAQAAALSESNVIVNANAALEAKEAAESAMSTATDFANEANTAKLAAQSAQTAANDAATAATNAANDASTAATNAANAVAGFDTKVVEANTTIDSKVSTATAKASEAANSATNAAASEANALTYKNNAATSASNAATSESNALTYKNNAAASATTASTKANDAANSAILADQKYTQASASANFASTKATDAMNQAGLAYTYATNAANAVAGFDAKVATANTNYDNKVGIFDNKVASANNTIDTKVATATTKATDAANSATTATTKAGEAAGSATAAAGSATAASGSAATASADATTATAKATEANASKDTAIAKATEAQSYAIGGTGTRAGEDTDNAKYYKEQAKAIAGPYTTEATFDAHASDLQKHKAAEDCLAYGVANAEGLLCVAGGFEFLSKMYDEVENNTFTTTDTANIYTLTFVTSLEDQYIRPIIDSAVRFGLFPMEPAVIHDGQIISYTTNTITISCADTLTNGVLCALAVHQSLVDTYAHAEGYKAVSKSLGAHAEGVCTYASRGTLYGITDIDDDTKTITVDAEVDLGMVLMTGYVVTLKTVTPEAYALVNIPVAAVSSDTITLATTASILGYNVVVVDTEDLTRTHSAHSEGVNTIALANGAHAEGMCTFAVETSTHTEGYRTTANGLCAHAEGSETYASGMYSHAAGKGTMAESDCQTSVGCYNLPAYDKEFLFVVGNGDNAENRSNAFTVDRMGVVDAIGTEEAQYRLNGRPLMSANTVYLAPGSWVDLDQTVTVHGLSQYDIVTVSPTAYSFDTYINAGIRCTFQTNNTLTFTCTVVPTVEVEVNLLIHNINDRPVY